MPVRSVRPSVARISRWVAPVDQVEPVGLVQARRRLGQEAIVGDAGRDGEVGADLRLDARLDLPGDRDKAAPEGRGRGAG